MSELRRLYDDLDKVLWEDKFADDNRLRAIISIDLCMLLLPKLSEIERQGVEQAKSYWSSALAEEHRTLALKPFSKKMDDYLPKSQGDALNRLVFSTLVTTEGLSGICGEYLI